VEKKQQHFVPSSYLDAWCDPDIPPKYDPFVWVHSEDGTATHKKSPKNIFKEVDFYTLPGEAGTRNLAVEEMLGSVETLFPRIRKSIREHRELPTGRDLETFCLYAILMMDRTKKRKENVLHTWERVHEMTSGLEKAHNAPRTLSLESEWLSHYGHIVQLSSILDVGLNNLTQMSKALLIAEGSATFITSDSPCFLHKPHSNKLPPLFRSPGFAHKDVELIFPVTPKALFVATWGDFHGTHAVGDSQVEELNRLIRFKCHHFFVTQKGQSHPSWFDPILPG
jgi:hypothetical protein